MANPARRDAAAVGLRYVSPDDPGISRRRTGAGFTYSDADGRRVRSPDELERIRRIAVPPAWTDVWICPQADGHIQAIGRDARGRRQYRYHPNFRARRDDGKFVRLIRFGEGLPRIRRRVRRDLARRDLPREKVIAAVVSLLESTRLRIGGEEYARLNRSFGISTLRNRHATVSGSTIRFRFRGKGGRTEERSLVDRRLAAVVRRCQDLPGQALFQFLDPGGEPDGVSSEDVNAYIREAAGYDEVSAKDFRTWTATLHAFQALQTLLTDAATAADDGGQADGGGRVSPAPPKRAVADALRQTAEKLGDTVTVTRNSYVHPAVLAAPRTEKRVTPPDEDPSRDDELALLSVLRAELRARRRGPATSSQVGGGRVTSRARGPAA
jgi:DNA topoisomerase-1